MKNKQYNLEQIYETALTVFAKFGFKKTAMRDVARELGMTQGNIYLYVKNKRDLYEKAVLLSQDKGCLLLADSKKEMLKSKPKSSKKAKK